MIYSKINLSLLAVQAGNQLHAFYRKYGRNWLPARLYHACEGIAALEFALVAPVFLMMLFGFMEFALIMTVNVLLDNAVSDAARYGLTGFALSGVSREQAILDIIEDRTGIMLDPNQLEISTLVYQSFDQIGVEEPYVDDNGNGEFDEGETYDDVNGNGNWDPDMGANGAGGAGDVVVYTITYNWPLLTPVAGYIAEGGSIPLSSTMVVRNEPYDTMSLGFGS